MCQCLDILSNVKITDKLRGRFYFLDIWKIDTLIDRDPCYKGLGRNNKERQEVYRKLQLDKEKGINNKLYNQLFLGTKEFIKRMEAKFRVNNTRLMRERPKKKED